MAAATADDIRTALGAVRTPGGSTDVVSAGLVDSVEVRGGLVHVALRTDRAHAGAMEAVRQIGRAHV